MFDTFRAAGALAGLMKNKEALREAGERIRRSLEELRCTGHGGEGRVRVTVSGKMRVLAVEIDPPLLAEPGARESIEGFVREAANSAMEQAQSKAQEVVAEEARQLGLPEMPGIERMLGA